MSGLDCAMMLLSGYRAVSVRNHMYVDPAATSQSIPINLKITFPELPCADVTVNVESRTANGKSIMSVMGLEGSCGKDIEIITTGEDASAALSALVDLIAARFGEAE